MNDVRMVLGAAWSGPVREVGGRPAVVIDDEAAARTLSTLARDAGVRLHPWAGGAPPTTDLPGDIVLVTPGPRLTGEILIKLDDGYVEVPAMAATAAVTARLARSPAWLPFAAAGSFGMMWGEVISRFPGNAFAPLYGELSRLLLGLYVLSDDGEVVHVGRRTVKGVAGYDIAKLFLGARGRAGLICRVRLRFFPRPADAALWELRGGEHVPDSNGLCSVGVGDVTLAYAEGPGGELVARAETLRAGGRGVNELVRGRAATEEFAAAAASLPFRAAAGPPAAGPSLSDLFI